jgi:hypothetical protein
VILLPDDILSRRRFVQCYDTIDDINFGVVTGRDKILQENFGERNFETKKFSLSLIRFLLLAFKTRIIDSSFCLNAYLNLKFE